MSEKENILARVREALRTRAPFPGHHGVAASGEEPHDDHAPASPQAQRWLPSVGPTFEDRLSLFQKNAVDLKADLRPLASADDLPLELARLRDAEGWRKIGAHKGELTAIACRALDLPLCQTDEPYDTRELETCDAGITECDALIAQTGSVLITSRSAGGRALSVLPPHHLVLARRDQLIPDLPSAFTLLKQKYQSNYPSFISLITGPSRTGDIERILVLGAHGPKKLTIFLLP
jgi:L-lactate dehydrogenase complex protein LldG